MSETLRLLIQEVAIEIQPKLSPLPGHPKRIAQAHIFGMIKTICSASYSEADFEQVKAIVEAIRLDPNGEIEDIIQSAMKIYESFGLD